MAIQLTDNATFLRIPKTGSAWVRSILEKNNLILAYKGHQHGDFDANLFGNRSMTGRQHLAEALHLLKGRVFPNSMNKNVRSPFRFCFVRDPFSWYESYWKFMEGRGWNDWGKINSSQHWHPCAVLNGLGSSDFNEFVWNVVNRRPGYVSELFYSYTKLGISYIGKTETLREDLLAVLRHLKVDFAEEDIFDSSRVNESNKPAKKIEWEPSLRKLVTQLEMPALVHFDYLTDSLKGQYSDQLKSITPHPALRAKLS